MAFATAEVLPVTPPLDRPSSWNFFSAPFAGLTGFFHRRRVYYATIRKIERYSERDLQDIGAFDGVEEFARRAARL